MDRNELMESLAVANHMNNEGMRVEAKVNALAAYVLSVTHLDGIESEPVPELTPEEQEAALAEWNESIAAVAKPLIEEAIERFKAELIEEIAQAAVTAARPLPGPHTILIGSNAPDSGTASPDSTTTTAGEPASADGDSADASAQAPEKEGGGSGRKA